MELISFVCFLQTEYVMTTDERDVYKTMGDHPNIVQHFIVTMKGQNGKANIFMEECGKCSANHLLYS